MKAFELKLAQGAKLRGGHVEGDKVTPEIAKIRNVEPYKTINSPNRFYEFDDVQTLLDFLTDIREATGLPVGMKIVVGQEKYVEELAKLMRETGKHQILLPSTAEKVEQALRIKSLQTVLDCH